MLTVQDMSTITKELILRMPPTLTTPEANEFREAVRADLAEMRKQGIAPDIPYDFD